MGTVLVSLAIPIDRAMPYFRIISAVFSVFTLASIGGIAFYLAETGFWVEVLECHPGEDPPW